ncbi:MAG: isochorismatase family protein [Planctomycetaceae bacterium]|nr:isochorismatase family protein [Planctomycetaceae bacterium]
MHLTISRNCLLLAILAALPWPLTAVAEPPATTPAKPSVKAWEHRLERIAQPAPLLADYPDYIAPLDETTRWQAPPLIEDDGGRLEVNSWRFSYNARGVIETRCLLDGAATAVIVVHPWGIDDGQGWNTPEPAGAAFKCTPEKNRICRQHVKDVIRPLVDRLRPQVRAVACSLPGKEDPVRKLLYRSVRQVPSPADRETGAAQLRRTMDQFSFRGTPLPTVLNFRTDRPVAAEYFRQFPALDAGSSYNGTGFWELPIPVVRELGWQPEDTVIYDGDGYPALRDWLRAQGIRHVLLAGYSTDMCVCETTAGYDNLRNDFNVFLVGDATLATFPASRTPRHATAAAVAFASLKVMVTQCSHIRILPEEQHNTASTPAANPAATAAP